METKVACHLSHVLASNVARRIILIDVNGTEYLANNQIVILEQLEKHGLKIPYSCRAGICGCCKMKLIAGEVIPLTKTAIKEDGVILSCSCIPKTNIKLLLS